MTPQDVLQWPLTLLVHLGAVFLRVGPVIGLAPGLGEQSVPVRVRLLLALTLSVALAPAIRPHFGSVPEAGPAIAHILAETLNGLLLGLALRILLLGLQTAGSMAAQAMSLSQVFGGAGVEPLPAFGHALVLGGLALAMIMGAHIALVHYILQSYDILPAGRMASGTDVAHWGIAMISGAFDLAFRLAIPFIVVSVIYNVTLGVINKAMPQLMVAFVGAPVITAGGLVILMLTIPAMLTIWQGALFTLLASPFGVTP